MTVMVIRTGKPRGVLAHFPKSTRTEESQGTYYPPTDAEVTFIRRAYDSRAVVEVRGTPDLQVTDELTALGALADVTLEWGPEHSSIEDNAGDAESVAWVKDQLARGNEWAWCSVVVRATWLGHEGTDSLGCCSYASEADFRRPGGYYDDMRRSALRGLMSAIEAASK